MARVAVSGYYGFNNTGDEAVLYSILRTLRAAKPDLKVTVFSNDPAKTAKQYNVEAVNRWKIKEIITTLRQSDVLISGGGSLLQDATGPKSIIYYLAVVWLAKLLRKPVVYYAQGVGPITSGLGKKLVPYVTNKVELVTVRDEASRELLVKLGVAKPPIYVTADPVLGLYHREVERNAGREALVRSGLPAKAGKPLVGIAPREWKNLSGYQKVLAQLGDTLTRRGYQVVLIPFQVPEDVAVCREIARLMEEEAVMLKGSCSVVEMLGLIAGMQLVVGMRLHALIMAAVMGVPAVGISYDPKVDSFLKTTEQPNAGRVETLDFSNLSREVFRVLENRDELAARLGKRVGELRAEARQSARLVLELLQNCDLRPSDLRSSR